MRCTRAISGLWVSLAFFFHAGQSLALPLNLSADFSGADYQTTDITFVNGAASRSSSGAPALNTSWPMKRNSGTEANATAVEANVISTETMTVPCEIHARMLLPVMESQSNTRE